MLSRPNWGCVRPRRPPPSSRPMRRRRPTCRQPTRPRRNRPMPVRLCRATRPRYTSRRADRPSADGGPRLHRGVATILPSSPRVGMVSLGCPKNLVDSERILSRLRADGYAMSPDYAGADVVLVNTCGFLDSAKEESLEAIGEAIAENGRVIVTGCMGKEAAQIRARFPDVLAITGPQQYEEVVAAVHEAAPPLASPFLDLVP